MGLTDLNCDKQLGGCTRVTSDRRKQENDLIFKKPFLVF